MKIAILGSGGREHALALQISKSKRLGKLYCIPGNAGTNLIATNINLKLNNPEKIERRLLTHEDPKSPISEAYRSLRTSLMYTKKGDKGKTQLLGGTMVDKFNHKIEAYGNIDELNSFIGHLHDQNIDRIEDFLNNSNLF